MSKRCAPVSASAACSDEDSRSVSVRWRLCRSENLRRGRLDVFLSLRGSRGAQDVQDVFPTQNACERLVIGDDREAGHFLFDQQSCGRLDGDLGCCRNWITAHDLMRPLVERGPVPVGLHQGADGGAEGFEQVSIGDHADQPPLFQHQQMVKPEFAKQLLDFGEGVVHGDGHHAPRHDLPDGE